MLYKKRYIFVIAGLLTQVSLSAMDMDRVNALAAEFAAKSGKKIAISTPTVKPTPTPIAESVPVAKPTKPAVEEVKVTIPEKSTEAVVTPTKDEEIKPVVIEEKVVASVTEESLGLRKVDLYSEDTTKPEATKYIKAAAGSSTRFDRAFENAPPMIPHDVEGMLPIKVGNNACIGCHMPDVAPSMKATPIPPSHFTSFRPLTAIAADGKITKEGSAVNNTSDFKTVAHKLNKLSSARFNCSQCHAPQSDIKPLVKNNFIPDFKSENGSKRSNLIDVINEGVE